VRPSFPDQRLGVFSCGHVMRAERPALLVSHDGGDWQFMCGNDDHDGQREPFHVSIGIIVSRDQTLNDVADLPSGWEAERRAVGMPWIRTRTGVADA
jgi:hypothetical protein